jgi:hypothetical protein
MAFWNWLWGKKSLDDRGSWAPQAPHAPYAPAPVPPPVPPVAMQQLQVNAPAAVPPVYGIQRAIELMRTLPADDDSGLVLRVVRKTLQSTGVSLEEIISSAKTRESAVMRGIESDRATIEQLDIQIATRRANIERLEMDLEETQSVRARLEEALASETKVGPSLSPGELARLRAEARSSESQAAAPAATPPFGVPVSEGAEGGRPPSAPVLKGTSGVGPKGPPKPPPAPTASTRPRPASPESTPSGARGAGGSSIPDIGEIDDAFNEPTARHDAKAREKRQDPGERND